VWGKGANFLFKQGLIGSGWWGNALFLKQGPNQIMTPLLSEPA